ncbi:hypothetical protein ABK905_12345 [Acerihabitans sp. KWT182]|uniref:Uncharacterized protein n=1 Tax=Acerihabitans sp. KWT182 TaxID=3157919 RepID=A0AAU7QEN4_9GAMM
MDIVEITPKKDLNGITAITACRFFVNLIGTAVRAGYFKKIASRPVPGQARKTAETGYASRRDRPVKPLKRGYALRRYRPGQRRKPGYALRRSGKGAFRPPQPSTPNFNP